MTTEIPEFLDLEDVLELHALQLARYGGADGVRDLGLARVGFGSAAGHMNRLCLPTSSSAPV